MYIFFNSCLSLAYIPPLEYIPIVHPPVSMVIERKLSNRFIEDKEFDSMSTQFLGRKKAANNKCHTTLISRVYHKKYDIQT